MKIGLDLVSEEESGGFVLGVVAKKNAESHESEAYRVPHKH